LINILHLSDIHFNAHENNEMVHARKEVLDKLIEYICSLDVNYKPDVILVTGDIAYTGSKEDYLLALTWFDKLSSATGTPHQNFFFSPGNHDVQRNARTIGGALKIRNNAKDADKDFASWQYKFTPLFENYIAFCSEFNAIPYRIGRKSKPSYLIGGRPTVSRAINVICLNSSWYHFDVEKNVKGKLWLGLPLIKEMNGYQLPNGTNYE
jgi:hypothetical protein